MKVIRGSGQTVNANDLTGTTLASGVTASSLTSFGASPTLTTPTIAATGFTNAQHAHAAANSGGQVGAGNLSGSTLASGITASSLTSVGTLTALTVSGVTDLPDGSAAAPSLTNTSDTDTGFYFPADNEIGIVTAGSERVRLDATGRVFISETANTLNDGGLTINQGANDDEALSLKSSDVDHKYTLQAETDTWGVIRKLTGTTGGMYLNSIKEHLGSGQSNSFLLSTFGGKADTDKGTNARALIEFRAAELDSGDPASVANVTANGNVFVVRAQVGGSLVARFAVDEDGDLFAVNTTITAITDTYDDVMLVRSLDHLRASRGAKGLIESRWDDFVKPRRRELYEAGVLGKDSDDSMLSLRGLGLMHNSAIWQQATRFFDMASILIETFPQLMLPFIDAGILPEAK